MSLTAFVWALLYGAALFGAFANPILGLFGYLLEYFQRPDLYWWGNDLPDLRWNFTIGAAAAVAYLLRRSSLEPFRRTTMVPLVLLLAQAVNTSIVTIWAISPELSIRWSTAYWKLVITFALFSGIVRNVRGLELVLLFQMIGAAYWGWDALDARRTGTRMEGIGSGDTNNSNLLASHLLTIIPLAIIFSLMKGPRWLRGIAIASTPLIVNLLILCNSRGATVGFGVAGAASIFLVRSGLRKRVLIGAAVGGLALLFLADPQFVRRQQTIGDPTDQSATSRLEIWAGAARMVADYPFGVGGRGFHILSPRYVPYLEEEGDDGRSAHNMYIQIAADWGIQGLALFLAFIGYVFTMLHRVRRERTVADRPYFISLGLELGLVATLTAAFFSVRFYGESLYWLCGLSTALYCMTSAEAKSEQTTLGGERVAA